MTAQHKRLVGIGLTIALLLLIPLIAMQFTDEVNWTLSDFAIMGTTLLGIGITYELIAGRSQQTVYRVAIGIALLGAFLLFWVNAAVGIIGYEGQAANLLYGLVFAVGLVGSLLARLQPRGMARTLFVAALTQMLVPVLALFIWPPPATSWSPSMVGVFLLTGFFALLFVISGWLFQRASKEDS